MMVSLKQRGFYILPSFPLFALGMGILIYPVVNFLILQIKHIHFPLKCSHRSVLLLLAWVSYYPSPMYMQ